MKKHFLLLSFVFTVLFVQAQQVTPQNYIEVRGKSEMKVTPDIVNLNITLFEQMEGREKVQIDRLEANLLSALKKNDINKSALTISDIDGIQEKVRRKKTGLMTTKHYNLRVMDVTKLDNLLFDLQEIKNISIQQGEVAYSNMSEIKDQLYTMAVKEAVHKADVMLGAAEASRGKVIWMEEGYNQLAGRPVMAMAKRSSLAMESADFMDNNVAIAKNTFTFEIRVRFAIK